MNNLKKSFLTILLAIVYIFVFAACNSTNNNSDKKEEKPKPEVGTWKAEYKLSDIDESAMTEEDRTLISLLAGNTVFEINAEFCDDGTFTYEINTDKISEALSNSVSKIASFFIDIDVSMFTDRLIEYAFQDLLKSSKTEYFGKYTKSDDGLITAVDGDNIYFKVTSSRLIQIDEQGNKVITFKKAS